MKIHLDERTALTSQLFFPESVTDEVYATSPYNLRGPRNTTNSSDGIFSPDTILAVTSSGNGLSASLVIGLSS